MSARISNVTERPLTTTVDTIVHIESSGLDRRVNTWGSPLTAQTLSQCYAADGEDAATSVGSVN
jgi:hypothetical protein